MTERTLLTGQTLLSPLESGTYETRLSKAYVDGVGNSTLTFASIAAALAATSAKGTIHVIADTTITASIVVSQEVTIQFWNGAKVFNNAAAGTDSFKSSIPIGSNGQVNKVIVKNPVVQRAAGATGRAGAAFNFHGAFAWKVEKPDIDGHSDGLYFDASPYPGGLGSHTTVYDPNITNCDRGINFAPISAAPAGSGANINQVLFPHIYSCTVPIWQQGGINNIVLGARIENLGTPVTTPLVIVDQGILHMPNYHIEGERTSNPFQLNGGSIFGDGNAYFYNGGGTAVPSAGYTEANGYVVIADAVTDMDLTIKANGRYVRSRGTVESIVRSTTTFPANIVEWKAPDADGGAPVVRGAFRTDGALRVPTRTTDPAASSSSPGDLWSIVGATSGRTSWRYRDPSNAVRYFAPLDLIPPQCKLADVTAAIVKTVWQAPTAVILASVQVMPDVAVSYAATDFWTVTLEDWNGNVKSADIVAVAQSAQITLSGLTVSAASYALPSGHTLRVHFTLTGAPPTITSPLIQVKFAPA